MLNIKKTQGSFYGKFKKVASSAIIAEWSTVLLDRITDTRLRIDLHDLISSGNIHDICRYEFSYIHYSIADCWRVRQLLALYTKSVDGGISDTQLFDEAVIRFMKTEVNCSKVNRAFSEDPSLKFLGRFESTFYRAQRIIADIIGDVPTFDDMKFAFGPGSSTVVKEKTTARHKLNAPITYSRELLSSLSELENTLPLYFGSHKDRYLDMGNLAAVPKNAITLRTILIEPHLNTAVQKMYGNIIRDRLLTAAGINLNDQCLNQQLARQASIDGLNATIDLSNASDSLSSLLVCNLLPLPWVEALSACRTGTILIRGYNNHVPLNLQKFSSMGNGYTFELESLMFFALTKSVCESLGVDTSSISIYGDDIICPSDVVDDLSKFFNLLGLEINLKKSFWNGTFRESCGADYIVGQNIRPFYVRDRLSNSTLVAFHNYLEKIAVTYIDECNHRVREQDQTYSFYNEVADTIRQLKSVCLQNLTMPIPFGPSEYGDGHLHDPLMWSLVDSRRDVKQKSLSGTFFYTFVKKDLRCKAPLEIGDSLLPAYSIYLRDPDASKGIDELFVYQKRGLRVSKRRYLRRLALDFAKANPDSRASDHYVLRNNEGFKSKKIKIYVLDKPIGFNVALNDSAVLKIMSTMPDWVVEEYNQESIKTIEVTNLDEKPVSPKFKVSKTTYCFHGVDSLEKLKSVLANPESSWYNCPIEWFDLSKL